MPGLELMTAFLVAAVIFAYMPGPAMLYAAAQTIARGQRGGLMASLGIHIGGYVHVLAAVLGLSVLFHAVPVLFTAAKLAGAIYLVWLGIKLFRNSKTLSTHPTEVTRKSSRRAFWESVLVEVLNPKTAIFYLAFLPQFADPAALYPIWLQLLILGTFVNVLFSSADLLCVAMAGAVLEKLRKSGRVQRLTQRIGGGILIGLGVNLAFNRQP